MEFNLKRDINKTIEMMEISQADESIVDPKYSKVYETGLINHKMLYQNIAPKISKYLGLLGSTAPALNAICLGAKDVTCFDISFPACYYSYFQIAAILSLEYEEYVEFIYNHFEKKSFNFDTYKKIREELYVGGSIDTKKYFDVLYDYMGEEEIRRHFFVKMELPKNLFLSMDKKLSLYASKEEFYKLKQKLKIVKFKVLQEDIRNIPSIVNGERFDMIYMAAAHEFIYEKYSSENILDYMRLMEKYKKLLTDDGILQVGYFYESSFLFFIEDTLEQLNAFETYGYQRVNVYEDDKKDIAYIHKKH